VSPPLPGPSSSRIAVAPDHKQDPGEPYSGPKAPGGLRQLLAFRHDCTTVTTSAEQAAATAGLGKAAEALHGLIELAEMIGRSGRAGKTDLN
jgi:hypothetical protein